MLCAVIHFCVYSNAEVFMYVCMHVYHKPPNILEQLRFVKLSDETGAEFDVVFDWRRALGI